MIDRVRFSKEASKNLDKIPTQIAKKLQSWVVSVELKHEEIEFVLIEEVNKHDY